MYKNLSRVKFCAALLGLSFLSLAAHGQAVSNPDSNIVKVDSPESKQRAKSEKRIVKRNEYSLWIGFALDSYQFWGKTKDVHIQSFGLRYNRKLLRFKNTILEYNLLTNLYSNYSYEGFAPYTYRSSLSGFGISPLGLQLNFLGDKTVQPFINSSAGFMYMDKPFPDTRGKKLNFTFSAGGGLEIMLSRSTSLSLGVKYYHLSNGERGKINPGVDSNIYSISVTFF